MVLERDKPGRHAHLWSGGGRYQAGGSTGGRVSRASSFNKLLRSYQDSLDEAIRDCSISTLKNSFTNLTADRSISHKLIHVTVKPGFLKGPSVIVEGYVLNSLIAKYAESTDRDVEDFLAASGGYNDIASFRGKVLEKRIGHQVLQRGGSIFVPQSPVSR